MGEIFRPQIARLLGAFSLKIALMGIALVASVVMPGGWIAAILLLPVFGYEIYSAFGREYELTDEYLERRHWRKVRRLSWDRVETIHQIGLGAGHSIWKRDGWEIKATDDFGKPLVVVVNLVGMSMHQIEGLERRLKCEISERKQTRDDARH